MNPTLVMESIPNADKCVVGGYSKVVLNDQGGQYMEISHDMTGTLRAEAGGHQPIVTMESIPNKSYCIAGNSIDRQIQNGCNGKGVIEEQSYTLNTIDRHAVVQPMSNGGGVQSAYCVGNGQVHQMYLQEKAGTLNCMNEQQYVMQQVTDEKLSTHCVQEMTDSQETKSSMTES